MIIQYREVNGRVEKRIIAHNHRSRSAAAEPHDRHFSETLLKAYYQLECEHGSRFRSAYSKKTIKRVHDTALARFAETGVQI